MLSFTAKATVEVGPDLVQELVMRKWGGTAACRPHQLAPRNEEVKLLGGPLPVSLSLSLLGPVPSS